MLRFLQKKSINTKIVISDKSLLLDRNIWENCKNIFKECSLQGECEHLLIPLKNEGGELLAYGYQDDEANRELRMLKELRRNQEALQFTDIFPQYQEVVICGCNELAFFLAEYLHELGVMTFVIGSFWSNFGYTDNGEIDFVEGGG